MNKIIKMKQQNGQVAIILLLFMLVALTIGLAATQRSLTNISTSSQTEQSSRAFSAAEAGLQRSISAVDPVILPPPAVPPTAPDIQESELGNGANASVNVVTDLPRSGEALEYPPIGRDTIAQFWLADPTNNSSNWDKATGNFTNHRFAYSGGSLDIYWGNSNPISNPAPAIEVNYIFQPANDTYSSKKFFFDPDNSRTAGNNFTPVSAGNCSLLPIHTSLSIDGSAATTDRSFYCRSTITIAAAETPVLLRIRVLYSNGNEPIAVVPASGFSLPPQAAIYTARGYSGQSQKILQVFRQPFYVSPLIDFALFSPALISK